jgi:hypothetical protein
MPLANGGTVDSDQRSITRTDGDVTITLRSSSWKADPQWIESYVTPIYAVIENNGGQPVELRYGHFVVLDERRVQYPALPPETVAARAQSIGRSYMSPPPPLFIGRRHVLVSPLFGWWYDPWPYYPYYVAANVREIYAEALPVGSVHPHARVQGFIYFTRLPNTPQQFTIVIGYERSGEPGHREITFPFAIQDRKGP